MNVPDISKNENKTIALVAILCDEEPFVDEWIAYHRMLGIDHFFLYDDDPRFSLKNYLEPYKDYVTVIPWHSKHELLKGRNRQTKAYNHALLNYCLDFKWTTFIDGDEYIILRSWENIKQFLNSFDRYDAISLNWHVFGHNGFFCDPKGLITSKLTRRMLTPSPNVKTISKSASIIDISSAHLCKLKKGSIRVDANEKRYTENIYEGKTERANINHYQCRSFMRWMGRVKRGDVALEGEEARLQKNKWRMDEYECLKQFVETVAVNKNEFIDDYMLKFEIPLRQMIKSVRSTRCSVIY